MDETTNQEKPLTRRDVVSRGDVIVAVVLGLVSAAIIVALVYTVVTTP